MAWFEHGTSRIHYEREGSGEPVLLLPGWGGSIEEFTPLREALAPGFSVIAADPPGSGKSGPQPREYSASYYQDDANSFLALLDDLAIGPTHLIGFSDGGEYALLMASLKPSIAHSVVTWGAGGFLIEAPGMLDGFYNLIDSPTPPFQRFADYMKATYGEPNARVMAQSESRALRAIIEAGGDISRSRATSISCPALLMTGEHDFLAPPTLVSETAKLIRQAQFVEVKNAGHAIHAERPEWLAETIVDWLGRH